MADTGTFEKRVEFAARYISSGKPTNRSFDGCFEDGDGDEVYAAIWKRATKRPGTKLARNFTKYLVPPESRPTDAV